MACSVTVTNGTLEQQEIDAYIARATKKYGVEPRHIDINAKRAEERDRVKHSIS